MYLGLQQKPFYFLTDRDTQYQYLVDNRDNKSPKRHLYYPDEYQKMSAKSIDKLKKNSVYKLLWWALRNQDILQLNDKKVINSTLQNSVILLVVCAFAGKSLRKILFITELPVMEIKLERLGFNVRILKTLLSYSIFTCIGFKFITSELRQTYLIDLAFSYKYHFADKMHSKADSLYEELWAERINRKTKAEQIV